MKPTALVISFSDLARDPRVNRQIRALCRRYGVIAAGTGAPSLEGVRFVAGRPQPRTFGRKVLEAARLLARRYEVHYWRLAHVAELRRRLLELRADVVIANDVEALPLAFEAAKGAPVILDAHEYAPAEFGSLRWRLLRQRYARHLCSLYIPRVAGMMTVAQGIAREYTKAYGISPIVVHNAAPYADLQPTRVSADIVRMIHHGNAIPTRRLEVMLHAMRLLPKRFHLDLMLLPSVPRYMEKLKAAAAGDARIRFLAPVAMRELVGATNQYDIGLYVLPPSSFNDAHALPNKFFEFVQSRLALAIGPSPEMTDLVKRYELGVVASSFAPEHVASVLSGLDAAQIDAMKHRAHEAARELCFEREEEKLLALVDRVAAAA